METIKVKNHRDLIALFGNDKLSTTDILNIFEAYVGENIPAFRVFDGTKNKNHNLKEVKKKNRDAVKKQLINWLEEHGNSLDEDLSFRVKISPLFVIQD